MATSCFPCKAGSLLPPPDPVGRGIDCWPGEQRGPRVPQGRHTHPSPPSPFTESLGSLFRAPTLHQVPAVGLYTLQAEGTVHLAAFPEVRSPKGGRRGGMGQGRLGSGTGKGCGPVALDRGREASAGAPLEGYDGGGGGLRPDGEAGVCRSRGRGPEALGEFQGRKPSCCRAVVSATWVRSSPGRRRRFHKGEGNLLSLGS